MKNIILAFLFLLSVKSGYACNDELEKGRERRASATIELSFQDIFSEIPAEERASIPENLIHEAVRHLSTGNYHAYLAESSKGPLPYPEEEFSDDYDIAAELTRLQKIKVITEMNEALTKCRIKIRISEFIAKAVQKKCR